MAVRPELSLNVPTFELPNPLAQMAQVTQIQNALQQQRMGDIQMQNALRQQEQQRKYESIVAGFAPNMPIGERVRALQTQGLASQAAQLAKTESELSEQQRKEALAGVNLANAKAEIVARYFPNVEDQNSYSQARLKAIATGQVKPTELPEQYDKNFVDALLRAGVSLKDQIANVFREREVGAREMSARASQQQAMTAADRAKWERANPGFDIQETATGFVKVNKRTGETTPLTMEGGAIGEAPVQLQPAPKGSRPQLLQLQDEQRMLEARGEGDTPRAREIRDQIRAMTSKGAPELSPKDIQAREAKYPQATLALRTFTEKTDDLIKDIKTLQRHAGLEGITGVVYGRTPSVTAESRAAQALLEKIMARGGFQELQNLRNSSPTGGALGQVSNQENAFLRQAFGALNTVQDTKDFRKALGQVIQELEGSKSRLSDAYDLTYEYRKQQNQDEGGLRSGTKRSTAPTSTVPSGGTTLKFDASGKLIE